MNILLINHYAGSPVHGMEFRPYYLARHWADRGHHVTIVAASYSHLRSVQPVVQGACTEELRDGIRYLWLRAPSYRGNGIDRVANMLAFLWRLWRARRALLRDAMPDVVIASSTYPLDIYPARSIARRAGARLIFEVHDLWPLSPMELGGMSRWHPFIAVMQTAENAAYRSADAVVSILPAARDHMVAHGMAPEKFIHVPNGIDRREWEEGAAALPPEHEQLFARLRSQGQFIVCYAGSHGIANALDNLVEAADLLRDETVAIVLAGKGPEKAVLQERAMQRGLRKVFFLPPVPKQAVPALLGRADALYIGARNQPLYRFGISMNKLMDYLMSARPIICAIRSANDLVGSSGSGYTIPPDDPGSAADAIRKLSALPDEERREMGGRGRTYVLTHHEYRVLAERFERVLADDHERNA